MFKEKSVLVGMSGGIDSTAVCSMLLEQGYRVEGLTLITCDSGLRAAEDAAALAAKLGIPHHVADVRGEFRKLVIEPFINEYMSGRTPNPCVNCNPTVKFSLLEKWADKLGCDKIATGHYVKKRELAGNDGKSKYYIETGDDDKKDQSYFLWRLTQQQLSRIIFPLGGWEKPDVLAYLKEHDLQSAAKEGESMEVCFIPGDYRDFLRANIPDIDKRLNGGLFVDCEGRTLGKHCGYPFYTIGQRKGLGIALGHPAYVIKINASKNTVMLGSEEQLLTRYMLIECPEWIDGIPGNISVRVRYRSRPIACDAPASVGDGRWLVRLHEAVQAITPGQSAVFYNGNTVVGGAFIADQRGINQWIPKE
ncbi:MAG: tRNA 2-thiouridine(34) synthase MnmA [Bacteroidaceae bacterium]|nr:tRNA 2-thiouridine(34) synthase MnmA [Bacteroidaceae bacterium]